MAKSISSFKENLKSLLFLDLTAFLIKTTLALTNSFVLSAVVHDQTFIMSVFLLIFSQFSFLFLFVWLDLQVLNIGCNYLFYSGWVLVLKPCRRLVSFCFMHLVLCTKSENK